MNLIVSLPLGIVIIIVTYLVLNRVFKNSLPIVAAALALLVLAIYSALAAISWPGADVYAIHIAVYLVTVYGMTIILKQRQKKTARLHWAPVTIFVFFGVILVTDSVLVFLAQSGMSPQIAKHILPNPDVKGEVYSVFPGTVSHDFKQKEHWFNNYQQKRKKQFELGWQVQPGWQQKAIAGQPNRLMVRVLDKDGQPLTGAGVHAQFLYPGDMKYDQLVELKYDKQGIYSASVTLGEIGDWDMVLDVHHSSGDYQLRSKTSIAAAQANPGPRPELK